MSTCEHGIDSQTGTCTECQIAGMQAENERLKETAKIAIQEIGAWSRKAGKLEAENERLKKTIREQGEQVQHLADNLKEARDENERLKAALSDYAGLANLVIGFIDIKPGHPLYMSIRQDIKGVLKVLKRRKEKDNELWNEQQYGASNEGRTAEDRSSCTGLG